MRLVYCLQFTLASPTTLMLIAWLDSAGNSPYCHPVDRSKRVADLGPGDQLRHRGKIYTIWEVEPYRWHEVDEAFLQSRGLKDHGFVVADAAGR
jgi:hypothetical protein